MTADPRVISDAYVIDRLSFEEAMELCNFGAKVVYPPTIFPVYHRDIPILIKNTFNPEAPGTFISRERVQGRDKAIKGISSINNTCLVTIQGAGHGRRDRRQPPHLPHTGQGRHQRLLRVAGRLGEHHVDRTAQRGRRSGHRDAHQGVRPRNRDRRGGQHHRRTRPGDDRRGGRRHETYARHRGQAVRDAGTQRHQRHRLHAGRLGDQHLGGRDARKPSEGDQRDPRLVLPVGVSGTQHLRGRRRTGGARPAGTDPPATAHAHGRQRTPNPRRGNRQLPQTAHRRRRHRPERLPPAARRGGNALDAGEPARRDSRP